MNLTIRAKSSGAEPYDVNFVVDDGQLSVFCNCQAGTFGKLCKHKTELLAGDRNRLFDESEEPKFVALQEIAKRATDIIQLARNIAESERIIRTEQAKLKKIKKEFETKLKQGVNLEPP